MKTESHYITGAINEQCTVIGALTDIKRLKTEGDLNEVYEYVANYAFDVVSKLEDFYSDCEDEKYDIIVSYIASNLDFMLKLGADFDFFDTLKRAIMIFESFLKDTRDQREILREILS